jgi:lysophospholipase L1-like esterase
LHVLLLALAACGSASAVVDAPQFAVLAADGGDRTYSPCPRDEPCRILPLGDSITYGVGYTGGYRVELFRESLAGGTSITFVGSQRNGPEIVDEVSFPQRHEGHGGFRIDQLMPLIPEPALHDSPHIVLLMVGTNDIGQDYDLADAPQRLGELLDALSEAAPSALIVVANITPLASDSQAVVRFNDALPEVIEARASAGRHVRLVDMFTGFPASELDDNVHPNVRGYKRLGENWYAAISEFLH